MKVIAICKTWRGHEYALASLNSVYNFVDKFIYLHSNRSWLGEVSPNTVRDIVRRHPDPDNKIIHLEYRPEQQDERHAPVLVDSQHRQYQQLFAEANKYKHELKMFIDTDEIWDANEMKEALAFIEGDPNPGNLSYQAAMYNHFKSPLYKTVQPVSLLPVCFVRAVVPYLGVRGNQTSVKTRLPAHFHHMVYTRNSLTAVLSKINDSIKVENSKSVDIKTWIAEKWNTAPNCTNSLPVADYITQQQELEVVNEIDLPATLVGHPIVRSWQRYLGLFHTKENPTDANGTQDTVARMAFGDEMDEQEAIKASLDGLAADLLDMEWEPRKDQQPPPLAPEKASNGEVWLVAGFIQELLERKHHGTPEKPKACIVEAAVREGEVKDHRVKGQRLFRVLTGQTYRNYQLESFKTAVPEKCARVYELKIELTVGNEPT